MLAKLNGPTQPTRQNGPCWFTLTVRLSLLFLLVSMKTAGGISAAIDSQEADTIHEYVDDMVQWLRVNGGFMSDKVEIRRRVPGDRSSPSGIFAVSDMATDEILFRVPSKLYISVEKQEQDEDSRRQTANNKNSTEAEGELIAYYDDLCRLATRLMNEIKRFRASPSSSPFAPYIRYLEDLQSKGQLPATYSESGKAVLRNIQGFSKNDPQPFRSANYGESPLPPADLVDWIDKYFVHTGCIDANDGDANHAVALVVQRGFDLELIPVWDMVNHDVRERVNIETSLVRSSEGLVVWAKRPIAAGEEILYSYNYCVDCEDAGEEWGTPGIFRDFGFLEAYPQEWPFLDQKVSVQIHQDHQNRTRFYATSLLPQLASDHEAGVMVDDESLAFFQAQLSRLKSIDLKLELAAVSPSLERYMIQSYYDSIIVALSTVIEQQAATGVQPQCHGMENNHETCIR